MTPINIISLSSREQFRDWLLSYSTEERECWIPIKKGKIKPVGIIWYLDAVEEALCFGWIDSTNKTIDGINYQRFSVRSKRSNWTELNKERCRRLIKLGLMTNRGFAVLPDLTREFEILPEVLEKFKSNNIAWQNFKSFHPLYQRVRIDTLQSEMQKGRMESYAKRLEKLISASEHGEMIGDWNDFGRLLDY